MGRDIGGRFKGEGMYVYLWLINVEVWQKITKFYKAIILQLKNKLILKKQCTNPFSHKDNIITSILLHFSEETNAINFIGFLSENMFVHNYI